MDALDAVLISLQGWGRCPRLVAFRSRPLTSALRRQLLRVAHNESVSIAMLCDLNIRVAYEAAAVVKSLLLPHPRKRVAVIGYHGHTLWHAPVPHLFMGQRLRSTFQIGDGPILAAVTGIPVVNNFRSKDLVHGGSGAPLVPFAHRLLFARAGKNIAVHNIGGIANLTYLSLKRPLACDTGPGNMLIDGLMRELYGRHCDRDGAIASRGDADLTLLKRLLDQRYFKTPPPKSTGREAFGAGYQTAFLKSARRRGLTKPDIIATATALTAASITQAYRDFVLPYGLDEIILCGGGAKNRFLVSLIAASLPLPVHTSAAYGWDPQHVEAVAFAILGYLAINHRVNQIGALTGSRKSLSLGQISYPD
jgi:anhydro-N-acetylmuramic acid kinase